MLEWSQVMVHVQPQELTDAVACWLQVNRWTHNGVRMYLWCFITKYVDRLVLYKHYNAIHQALYFLVPGELSPEPVMVMVVVVVGLPNVVYQWILQKINIVYNVTISGMLNSLHNFSLRRQKHSPFGNQVFKVCMCSISVVIRRAIWVVGFCGYQGSTTWVPKLSSTWNTLPLITTETHSPDNSSDNHWIILIRPTPARVHVFTYMCSSPLKYKHT